MSTLTLLDVRVTRAQGSSTVLCCIANWLYKVESFWGATADQLNFPPFMETEGPLPCSQKPATVSYPGSDKSYFYRATVSNLRISLPYVDLQSGLISFGCPTTILYKFLSSYVRSTCLDRLILLDLIELITSGKGYKLWSSSSCNIPQPSVISSLSDLNIFPNSVLRYS
jgi:hypothetical protein